MPSRPVIIEAAINGGNPDAPRTPEAIAATALACLDAGAAIVHNHIDIVGDAATVAARYREGWDPVLAERPDALLYPHHQRRRRSRDRGSATSHRSRSRASSASASSIPVP